MQILPVCIFIICYLHQNNKQKANQNPDVCVKIMDDRKIEASEPFCKSEQKDSKNQRSSEFIDYTRSLTNTTGET